MPNHVPALQTYIVYLLKQEKYEAALTWLDQLEKILPDDSSLVGLWAMRARAHRALDHIDAERAALVELVSRNADATDALRRLMEIEQQQQRWPDVIKWADELLAVNPFLSDIHRNRAEAASSAGNPAVSADSWKALLSLNPIDPAEAHLKYAQARAANGQSELAERHALMAIEEAPRYQEALRFYASLKKSTSLPTHTTLPEFEAEPPAPLSRVENSTTEVSR